MTVLLGPFLGHVTSNSIKIWLHREADENKAYVTVHEEIESAIISSAAYTFIADNLYTDCITIQNLKPDQKYFYKLWADQEFTIPIDLQGLENRDLYFWTLSVDKNEQIDFLIMSCHNPTVSQEDGNEGHAVWADIPQIIASESNKNVRFAILGGDQIYADDMKDQLLAETDEKKRLNIYLEVYRTFWSHIHYRRVLCRLPSVMMWDDHDITDGWGSELKSFVGKTDQFKPEWQGLFSSAAKAFSIMQATRNPEPLAKDYQEGLDFGFKVGSYGFLALDLRTNRNVKKKQLLNSQQTRRIQSWVENNKSDLRVLFVVSPVVFSHGSPVIEDLLSWGWPWVMKVVDWMANCSKWGKGMRTNFYKNIGDIRDDIADSWGSKENAAQADMMLDYLFDLQNNKDHPISVVILSGDIHTSGYSSIYSNSEDHKSRSSITHITSSSVAYVPFNWLLEAIYRNASKMTDLGSKRCYSSQISHHFCNRSVAVISLRPKSQDDIQMKVKYYVEGYPEPHVTIFDLDRVSHRENIAWVAQDNIFDKKYTTSSLDVEASLRERAELSGQKLNVATSVVDLMKALGMDSSLGSRKRLAQQLGYTGILNGSAEMNIWLHKEIKKKYAGK